MFAAVPAVAAAACAPVATVFAVCAVVFAPAAAVLAVCAAVFATCAAVSAVVAVVPAANILFHHCFMPLSVTSVNALSLFNVCCTCCKPTVILIRLCTLSIIFCRSSFSPANNATAPCAALNAPETPESPLISPCIPAWSCAKMLACACASAIASVRRAASACISAYSFVPRCPAISISTNASRHCLSWVLREVWVASFFRAASSFCRIARSSATNASEAFPASSTSFLRRRISDAIWSRWFFTLRNSLSLPLINALSITSPKALYLPSSFAISLWFSPIIASILANAASKAFVASVNDAPKSLPAFTPSTLNCVIACLLSSIIFFSWSFEAVKSNDKPPPLMFITVRLTC